MTEREPLASALDALEGMARTRPRDWDDAGFSRAKLGTLRAYPHPLTMFEALDILRAHLKPPAD